MFWKGLFIGIVTLNAASLFAESQPKKSQKQPLQTFMNGEVGVLTPPSTPKTQGIYAILSGDFLYWIAREDGLEYDLKSSMLFASGMKDMDVQEPVFQWAPGFRGTIGVRIPRDSWEVKGQWTHLQTHASQTTTAIPGTMNNVVYDDTAGFIETADSTSIFSKWNLLYNQFNAGLSRGFFLGKNLSTEIGFGGVGLWIDQKLKLNYPNFETTSLNYTSLPAEFGVAPRFENEYKAGGLFFSAKPQWNLSPSWCILANGTGYLVHGTFKLSQNWSVAQSNGNDLSIAKKYTRTRVGLQGSLGIQWQTSTRDENFHFALSAQYEGLIWFKQNLWSQVNTLFAENYERRGDLEMQGIAVSARLDF